MNAAMSIALPVKEVVEVATLDGRRLRVTVRNVTAPVGVLILLPAGLKYSVGPHRLNQKLSRELASLGWASAFVDPGGYGDSEGPPPADTTAEAWRRIEAGGLADDILTATRSLRSRFPGLPVLACGLCGGAVTAVIAAARDPELFDGVISFSMAVQITPAGTGSIPLNSPTFARNLLGAYAQRALSADAWRRVFQGEARILGPLRAIAATLRHALTPVEQNSIQGLNIALRDALRVLASRQTPQLMIFGSSDRRYHEFLDASARGLWLDGGVPSCCQVDVTPEANHEFHFPQWQALAFRVVREWTAKNFACSTSARP